MSAIGVAVAQFLHEFCEFACLELAAYLEADSTVANVLLEPIILKLRP